VTNPAPPRCRSNGFQRIYVALQTTPEEPRQRNGPLGAPKRRPDPPQPAPHPPRLVCGGNHGAGTRWCPSGGDPRWRWPGRRRPKSSRFICGNAQGPAFGPPENQTAPYAINKAPGLPSYEKYKKSPIAFQQILTVCSRSLNTSRPLWSPVVAWCPGLGWHSAWCDHSVLGRNEQRPWGARFAR
jgi:hypothetical protein